ncbi:MAG: ABC transporter permease [Clostridiales bacterium]|jgi:spermidine/putrescine transport system permease protein|nr:ABC transporter permease [Clostridiales bacterium]
MVKKILARAYVGIILLILYAPIVTIIIFSFTESRVSGGWSGFSFGNYISLFQNAKIGAAILNTLIIAVVSAIIATFLGTLAAVGISNMRKTARTIVNGVNQIPVLNADIVTAICLFLFFSYFIDGGYVTLIISHVLICTPFVIMSVMPRIRQLNPNLYEAALDLGASPKKALFSVIIPQLIPSMISGALLAFTLSLDDFVISQYNRGTDGIDTISTYIYNNLKRGLDPAFRALSTLIFLVVLGILIAINIRSKQANKKNGGNLN